jgi:DNA anti-recombination protein RmuC
MENSKEKINLELNKEFLKIIDELAELTRTDQNTILTAIIATGILPYCNYLSKTWKEFAEEKRYNKIKEEVTNLIKKIEEIKTKHEWLDKKGYEKLFD